MRIHRNPLPSSLFLCLVALQGTLIFKGDATFTNNEALTPSSTDLGKGGAIANRRTGSITFEGKLTATNNNADVRSLRRYPTCDSAVVSFVPTSVSSIELQLCMVVAGRCT